MSDLLTIADQFTGFNPALFVLSILAFCFGGSLVIGVFMAFIAGRAKTRVMRMLDEEPIGDASTLGRRFRR